MKTYYDKDTNKDLIKNKKIAIFGYGSQGHAHALHLRDSGVSNVVVALREGSSSTKKAESEGFEVMNIHEASKWADLIMFTMPDELQAETYRNSVRDNLKDGSAVAFAHGLNIHFGLIEPKPSIDVIMMAPKGPGHVVRSQYKEGKGVPALIAVLKGSSKDSKKITNKQSYCNCLLYTSPSPRDLSTSRMPSSA